MKKENEILVLEPSDMKLHAYYKPFNQLRLDDFVISMYDVQMAQDIIYSDNISYSQATHD